MENFKKILTIILSIGLLFLVSCGDRPTGSGDVDNQINALFDKFPKPSTAPENAVNDNSLDGNYESDGNLAIVLDETDAINYPGATKEDIIKNEAAKAGFLEISGGKATGYVDYKSQDGKLFENVQIYKSSGKYYAVKEITTPFEEGNSRTDNFYIEFNKDDSNGNLTSFKIMQLVRINSRGNNYAVQKTYSGTLIKDTSSGGSQ